MYIINKDYPGPGWGYLRDNYKFEPPRDPSSSVMEPNESHESLCWTRCDPVNYMLIQFNIHSAAK